MSIKSSTVTSFIFALFSFLMRFSFFFCLQSLNFEPWYVALVFRQKFGAIFWGYRLVSHFEMIQRSCDFPLFRGNLFAMHTEFADMSPTGSRLSILICLIKPFCKYCTLSKKSYKQIISVLHRTAQLQSLCKNYQTWISNIRHLLIIYFRTWKMLELSFDYSNQ